MNRRQNKVGCNDGYRGSVSRKTSHRYYLEFIRSTCQDVDQSVVLEQQGPDFILFVDAKKSTNGD